MSSGILNRLKGLDRANAIAKSGAIVTPDARMVLYTAYMDVVSRIDMRAINAKG